MVAGRAGAANPSFEQREADKVGGVILLEPDARLERVTRIVLENAPRRPSREMAWIWNRSRNKSQWCEPRHPASTPSRGLRAPRRLSRIWFYRQQQVGGGGRAGPRRGLA
ncbi:hypothetical protein ACFX13_019034 [Malus domestica]